MSQSIPLSPAVEKCIAKMPKDALHWSPVYLEVTAGNAVYNSSAGLLATRIAARIFAKLGAVDGGTPSLDAMFTWRDLRHVLVLTATREGSLQWSMDTTGSNLVAGPWESSAVHKLVVPALEQIVATGEGLVWPDKAPSSIAVLFIALRSNVLDREGNVRTQPPGSPVFSLMVPWSEAAVRKVRAAPTYPAGAANAGVRGNVVMRFLVGENGKISMLRDAPPDSLPENLTGPYRELVQEIEQSLRKSSFEPARIGGCAVPQYMGYTFALPGIPSGRVGR